MMMRLIIMVFIVRSIHSNRRKNIALHFQIVIRDSDDDNIVMNYDNGNSMDVSVPYMAGNSSVSVENERYETLEDLQKGTVHDQWNPQNNQQIQTQKAPQAELLQAAQAMYLQQQMIMQSKPEKREHELVATKEVKIEEAKMQEEMIRELTKRLAEAQEALKRNPLTQESIARVAVQHHEVKINPQEINSTIQQMNNERGYAPPPKPKQDDIDSADLFSQDDPRRYVVQIVNGTPQLSRKRSEEEFAEHLQKHFPDDFSKYQRVKEEQRRRQLPPSSSLALPPGASAFNNSNSTSFAIPVPAWSIFDRGLGNAW